MDKCNGNLQIVTLRKLLGDNLSIPGYQRPYRWSTDSAATLVNDTFNAFITKIPEYRIGSVVLHNKDGKLEIVDGQQRLTTLSILVYCFYQADTSRAELKDLAQLLNATYNDLSTEAIVSNYQLLSRKVNEIDTTVADRFIKYLLDECTMVRIVTDNEQEAFQFFDSQNSRGKALDPHDLLKSYHLREMNDEEENLKIKIIDKWEGTKQKKLVQLFEDNLYPMVRWYKYQDGLGYSAKNIKTFKGIKKSNNYNFSVYNRAANLYIERFNQERMYELTSGGQINQFQLTQPIIAGKRFFEYTLHYLMLKEQAEQLIDFKFKPTNQTDISYIPESGSGDGYIKTLFVNVVMFFIDKFNIDALTDARLEQLYKWAYSLRLVMKAVYKESVNRYAQGFNDRVNSGVNMFERISEMQDPAELDAIVLDFVEEADMTNYKVNAAKYRHIWERINK